MTQPGDPMIHAGTERLVPAVLFTLARPAAHGEDVLWFNPPESWHQDHVPLNAGQYFRIGWELRVILEVGERCSHAATLDDHHQISDEVEGMEQGQG